MRGACGIADAPAGHRIGLGHAVAGERAVIEAGFDLRRGGEFEIVEDKVFVHVVGHDPDMGMAHQDIGQRLDLGPRIGGTRRVRRAVEDEPLGFRRDRGLKLRRGQLEVAVDAAGHRNRRAARQQHHVGIADPVGRGDDDFVARVQRRHECVVERLLAAGPDRDLRGRIGQAVFAQEFRADRGLQFRNAVHGGVFGLASVDRALGGVLDMVGRVEIRLARAEADDILACGSQFARAVGDRDGRRRLHAGDCVGQEGHGLLRV